MSIDTGELIIKKSTNLCCQAIFSYISSLIIAPNAPFSQSLSHMFYLDLEINFLKVSQLLILPWSVMHVG